MKKIASLVLFSVLSGAALLSAQETDTPTNADVGYSFGVLMGQSLKSTGLDYDLEQIVQALKDSLLPGASPRWDAEQAKTILTAALSLAESRASEAKVAQEQAWLADHGKTVGVVTTASGLQYEILSQGSGARPVETDTVKVNYIGKLTDGTEFDSSVARGEPAVFPLGQVIPAWTEGIQLMGVGDKFRFTIPSALAYGPDGAGGVIPPYATLIFEVELLSIEAPEEGAADAAQ